MGGLKKTLVFGAVLGAALGVAKRAPAVGWMQMHASQCLPVSGGGSPLGTGVYTVETNAWCWGVSNWGISNYCASVERLWCPLPNPYVFSTVTDFIKGVGLQVYNRSPTTPLTCIVFGVDQDGAVVASETASIGFTGNGGPSGPLGFGTPYGAGTFNVILACDVPGEYAGNLSYLSSISYLYGPPGFGGY